MDFPQEFFLLENIPHDKFPEHICIIPDGNGRWAKKHKKFVTEGHRKGFDAARKIIEMLSNIPQVKIVTIWGFSSDNWKRNKREIAGLMRIFELLVQMFLKKAKENNARFIHLGRKDRIPSFLKKALIYAEDATKHNTGQIVVIAIDFGGEDQDIRSIELARQQPYIQVDPTTLWQFRDGNGQIKSADLLIRTSGEFRTSDIGWLNGARTELYFTPKFFPDIIPMDIAIAIVDFSKRERRMGGRK